MDGDEGRPVRRWVLAVAVPLPAVVLGAIGLFDHMVIHLEMATALWQLPVLLLPLVLIAVFRRTRGDRPPTLGRARRALRAIAVALPGLALAGIGLIHPMSLTDGNGPWWWRMHLLLLPLFPLLGVTVWALVHGEHGPLAWLARVGAYVYGTFYLAMDIVVGIVMGQLVEKYQGQSEWLPGIMTAMHDPAAFSKSLAAIGYGGLLVAVALAGVIAIRRDGSRAVAGVVVLCGSAALFVNNHIMWPQGVLTMIGFALGAFLLVMARRLAGKAEPVPAPGPDAVPAPA